MTTTIITTEFQITEDITAFMERSGADYTGNLVVRSEKEDDYDIAQLNEDGGWETTFDSLSNKIATEANETWPSTPEFQEWVQSMKAFVPA